MVQQIIRSSMTARNTIKLKLTYSDDSDPESMVTTFQRKFAVTIESDRTPLLQLPNAHAHGYQRLTSTTSTRTDTTTVSDDSLDTSDIHHGPLITFHTFNK